MTTLRRLPMVVYYLFLSAGLVAAALGARASTAPESRSLPVRIADLNPATADGVAAIYSRIERAAREVCGPDDLSGLRLYSEDWRGCVSTAVARAVHDVNAPLLSAYSEGRQHHRTRVREGRASS